MAADEKTTMRDLVLLALLVVLAIGLRERNANSLARGRAA